MGFAQEKPPAQDDSPEFPQDFQKIYSDYYRLKFASVETDDGLKLIARPAITFTELKSYSVELSRFETDIIMSLDAIFESRELNNG